MGFFLLLLICIEFNKYLQLYCNFFSHIFFNKYITKINNMVFFLLCKFVFNCLNTINEIWNYIYMHIIFNFVNCCFYYVFSLLFVVVAVVNKECAIWRWTQPERWCGIICHELAQNGSNWQLSQCIFVFQTTTLLPFVHLNLATRIHLHAVFFRFS